MKASVIVVGAGAAGIAAARALASAGESVVVVEARRRIGGRIWTLHDRRLPLPVELGAEFIHGYPAETERLIADGTLATHEMPFEHWWKRGGRLQRAENYAKALVAATRGAARLRQDATFAEYLLRRSRGAPVRLNQTARMALDFVRGFNAADPARISARAVAEEVAAFVEEEGGPRNARLLDGQLALLEKMRRAPARGRVELRLGFAVDEVRWRRGAVEVRHRHEVVRAPRAVITLPIGVLALAPEAPGAVRFDPDLPRKREAVSRLGSGAVVKAIVAFDAPFWESGAAARAAGVVEGDLRHACFLHEPDAAFPTWWTTQPLRTALMTGWAGGPRASVLRGLSQVELIERAIASLAALLGRRPASIRRRLRWARVHDWTNDPWSRGAYSYECVGGRPARRALAAPIEDTLHFAGEATAAPGKVSTVEGALTSGRRAAREILAGREEATA